MSLLSARSRRLDALIILLSGVIESLTTVKVSVVEEPVFAITVFRVSSFSSFPLRKARPMDLVF